MRAIKNQFQKYTGYATVILPVLLFLCTAGIVKAGDINNPGKAISNEIVSLNESEIAEANYLSVASNTLFSFSIPQNDFVRLSIFDQSGREISVLVNEYKKAGEFSADLNKAKLTKGSYFYRLVVGKFKEVRRLNIIK